MRILVVRNDKIGDFMVAWPAFAMLKASMPCHITALVPQYTQVLAHLCPYIDDVIVDCGEEGDKTAQNELVQELKAQAFDAAICYYSTLRNARLMRKAKIPQRWAPATKWFQWMYNHRLVQRRSKSIKAEFEYNEDLSRAFLSHQKQSVKVVLGPHLVFEPEVLSGFKTSLAARFGLEETAPWFIVHAGSGGSASNLTVEQFAALAQQLKQAVPECQLILTAGPADHEPVTALSRLLKGQAVVVEGLSLEALSQLIACAQLFVAGSTGPLHIAGAVDTPTVGFFSNRRSATGVRWRPINTDGRHLGVQSKDESPEAEQLIIDVDEVAKRLIQWYQALQ